MRVISFEYSITAKRQPKSLNSGTFGMNISWPKIMFQCYPMIQIDALRPPLLLYTSTTRIWISYYWQCYETKLTEKQKSMNWTQLVTVLPVTSSITFIGRRYLHIHVTRLNQQQVHMCFLNVCQRQTYCWYLIFFV